MRTVVTLLTVMAAILVVAGGVALAEMVDCSKDLSRACFGTDGNDRITGTDARDEIDAFGGVDEVDGKGGNDAIFGSEGADLRLSG
jgi:Ca2+-binding RTX toxin-like protein